VFVIANDLPEPGYLGNSAFLANIIEVQTDFMVR